MEWEFYPENNVYSITIRPGQSWNIGDEDGTNYWGPCEVNFYAENPETFTVYATGEISRYGESYDNSEIETRGFTWGDGRYRYPSNSNIYLMRKDDVHLYTYDMEFRLND